MENIQFHEDVAARAPTVSNEPPGGLVGLLMRKGLAKTKRDADIFLMATIGLCVIGAISIYVLAGTPPEPVPIPEDVLRAMEMK